MEMAKFGIQFAKNNEEPEEEPVAEEPVAPPPPPPEYDGPVERDPKLYFYDSIVLEKVAGRSPVIPTRHAWKRPRIARLGHIFTYTFKAQTRDNAVGRAGKALVAEFPDENILHWKEIR